MAAPPFTSTTEYDAIAELLNILDPSIDTDASTFTTTVDLMVRYLSIYTSITEYDETANSTANLKHRILLCRLYIWFIHEPENKSQWSSVRVYNIQISTSASSYRGNQYWDAFANDVTAFGYSLSNTNSPWKAVGFAAYDSDDYVVDSEYDELPDNY